MVLRIYASFCDKYYFENDYIKDSIGGLFEFKQRFRRIKTLVTNMNNEQYFEARQIYDDITNILHLFQTFKTGQQNIISEQ